MVRQSKKSNQSVSVMKTIAILALTAAALVSCQNQNQQQQHETNPPADTVPPVVTVK